MRKADRAAYKYSFLCALMLTYLKYVALRCSRSKHFWLTLSVQTISVLTAIFINVTPAQAQRIVSINLCADELLLRLKDKSSIISVSMLARDGAISNIADKIKDIPVNRGLAEELVDLKPDLVLAGQYTAQQSLHMLRHVGLPVIVLKEPTTLDGVKAHILDIAQQLGEKERGEAMIAQMDVKLESVAPPNNRPAALILKPNGVTSGKGSLSDAVLTHAGFRNLANELGIATFGQVPLELIVKAKPDFIIIDREYADRPARSDEFLNHPALRALKNTKFIQISARYWTCACPENADAVVLLSKARQTIQ